MFAQSKLEFSPILVSISAVSLTGRQTWQNGERIAKNSKCTGREKTSEKEISNCFCLFSFCFGEKFPTAEF
jgi:hypothetical protein